jgi:CheY-like chemotaxis protein
VAIPSRACRVLVVEDYADAIEATRLILQVLGHECRAAATGSDAIALVDAFVPDVVLLDLGLPDMDGFEVARRLRAKLGNARPRIVALTGWTDEDIPMRARAAGIDRVFLKPISTDVLRVILDRRRK